MDKSDKKGLFGRFSAKIDDALQSGRDPERRIGGDGGLAPASAPADDIAVRRPRPGPGHRMLIPEGVVIDGSVRGASESEISGRVEGDVFVDGRLLLGAQGVIAGNVRAASCRIEGKVEGKVECAEDLEVGESGRLNADVQAGRRINLAGQVSGNVVTAGVLTLGASCKVTGDIQTRSLIMEEGATLNGACSMRAPAQRSGSKSK